MCVSGHVILVFNECFIFVGPIFPLECIRTLKFGFQFPLLLTTTCHMRGGCAQNREQPGRVSKSSSQLPHSLEDVDWAPRSHSVCSLMSLLSSIYDGPIVLREQGGSEWLCDLPKGLKGESSRSRAASMRLPSSPHSDIRVWYGCGSSDHPLGFFSGGLVGRDYF